MKKIIFVLALSLSLSFSSFLSFGYTKSINTHQSYFVFSEADPEIDYIEYVCVDEQWYKIIHYTDGTIGVVPVHAPPFD
jgi:hypothetical protein